MTLSGECPCCSCHDYGSLCRQIVSLMASSDECVCCHIRRGDVAQLVEHRAGFLYPSWLHLANFFAATCLVNFFAATWHLTLCILRGFIWWISLPQHVIWLFVSFMTSCGKFLCRNMSYGSLYPSWLHVVNFFAATCRMALCILHDFMWWISLPQHVIWLFASFMTSCGEFLCRNMSYGSLRPSWLRLVNFFAETCLVNFFASTCHMTLCVFHDFIWWISLPQHVIWLCVSLRASSGDCPCCHLSWVFATRIFFSVTVVKC